MKTKNLVKASATVVTIRTLEKGDVYRRVETSSFASDKIVFGVVTDIGHNGKDAFVQALEFDPTDYSGDIERKSFSTDKELALFSALPEEFIAAAADSRHAATRAIQTKEREAEKARANLALLDGMTATALTAAKTSVDVDA